MDELLADRVSRLPSPRATGVFRAATDVAAAPPRGANPPFATDEQPSGGGIEAFNHRQFGKALHGSVAVEVFTNLLYLLGGEKRQLLQVFARRRGEVYLLLV